MRLYCDPFSWEEFKELMFGILHLQGTRFTNRLRASYTAESISRLPGTHFLTIWPTCGGISLPMTTSTLVLSFIIQRLQINMVLKLISWIIPWILGNCLCLADSDNTRAYTYANSKLFEGLFLDPSVADCFFGVLLFEGRRRFFFRPLVAASFGRTKERRRTANFSRHKPRCSL